MSELTRKNILSPKWARIWGMVDFIVLLFFVANIIFLLQPFAMYVSFDGETYFTTKLTIHVPLLVALYLLYGFVVTPILIKRGIWDGFLNGGTITDEAHAQLSEQALQLNSKHGRKELINQVYQPVGDYAVRTVTLYLPKILSALKVFIAKLPSIWSKCFTATKKFFKDLPKNFVPFFKALPSRLVKFFKALPSYFVRFFKAMPKFFKALPNWFKRMASATGAWAVGVPTKVKAGITELTEKSKQLISKISSQDQTTKQESEQEPDQPEQETEKTESEQEPEQETESDQPEQEPEQETESTNTQPTQAKKEEEDA